MGITALTIPQTWHTDFGEGTVLMIEMMNDIPPVADTIRESFICQQYWHAGVLTADINVLFLKIANGPWYRFFFDYGVFFCKQVDTPDIWQTSTQEEHHYPHIDMGTRYDLNGKTILAFQVINQKPFPMLTIQFSSSITVRVIDQGEQMRLSIDHRE